METLTSETPNDHEDNLDPPNTGTFRKKYDSQSVPKCN